MAANSKAPPRVVCTAQDAVNVQVILRCRPPSKEEVAARTPQVVKCDEAMKSVTLTQSLPNSKQHTTRTYHFDKVFPPETSQEKLYGSAVSSIVEEVLEGFNCTIFAYGQTGTGKTHTMTGDLGEELGAGAGVIPRAIHQIFAYLDGLASEYTVKCSYLELYNEEITDLLAVGAEVPKVRIMEDRSGVVLAGIEESIVKSSREIFALLEQGSAKRRTAETLLNKQSSRSHSVFNVTVSVREVTPEGDEVIRVGKLYLVDLAGSENITRSGAVEQRAKEAGNINKSLLTLGRVITSLVEGQGHVPYRDSKLTRLLRDSLGGKTKTCIIATIAPTVHCQEETLSTLDYAHRAKNIKNKPEVNARISKTTHLKEMNFEIEKLKQMLLATREKNGVYIPAQQYEDECEERRVLSARCEELEEEAEAVAAQHELAREEWQREVAAQRAAHELQMGQVRGELAATREELAAARLACQEREAAMEVQQRCEAALAGHAAALNAALAAAAADVALLFERWDEKNELEDANLKLVQELRAAATDRLAAMEAAVSGAAQAQAQRFEGVATLLAGFAKRKAAEASRLQRDSAALQAQLEAVGAAAAAAAEAVQGAGAGALSGLGQQQAAHLEAASAAAAAAREQLADAYACLGSALQEEEQQLGTFMAEQQAAVKAAAAATQAALAAARQQFEAAREAAAAARGDVATRMGAAAGAVDAFEASFLQRSQAERAALLQQVTGLLASFASKAEAEVKGAAAGLRTRLASDRTEMEGALDGMVESAQASLTTLDANKGAAAAAHDALADGLQAGGAAVRAALAATSQRGSDLQGVAAGAAEEGVARLQAHSAAVAEAVAGQTAALAGLAAEEQGKCADAVAQAAAARSGMQAAAAASLDADGADGGRLRQLGEEGGAAMAGFADEHTAALAALSGLVQEQAGGRYRADANRDKVPSQRQHAVPPSSEIDALRAPAPEQLFAQFRARSAAEQPTTGAAATGDEDMAADAVSEQDAEASGDDSAAEEATENADASNVAVAAPRVPPLDTALPALKGVRPALSPSALGKRSRGVEGETPVTGRTPSKLRGAFARSQQRSARGEQRD